MDRLSKIINLKGIGDKTAALFNKIGIETIGDLLDYFPRTYDVYEEPVPISEAEEGKTVAVTGAVYGNIAVAGTKNLQITTLYLKDITGTIKVIWYRMPFLKNSLRGLKTLTLRGKITRKKDVLVMEQPEIFNTYEAYEKKCDTLQPVYALTKGLTNNMIIKAMSQAVKYVDGINDPLPDIIKEKYDLMDYKDAVRTIHFPEKKADFYKGRNRLVFDEFLRFIIGIRNMKEKEEVILNKYNIEDSKKIDDFIEKLPFKLTNAQLKVWNEIKKDMTGEKVMSRLVQGDVGSGKTIVALLGLMLSGLNGYQSAMMAPTEVLARQHFNKITQLFEKYDIPLKTELLTGSMTAKEKREAYKRIESGESDVIIGTHAVIQEKVVFKNLCLVVTDEQHRFGVNQREEFLKKGDSVHVLVMSATPIPRTLAIILYGDLDISIIDEKPENRLPIKNCVVDTGYRNTAYKFLYKEIKNGRQCYVICPMVEESEGMEGENVIDYASTLQEIFGEGIKVQYLHGKMKQKEKDTIMSDFASGKINILVSTTVIEVGIDVANATVMMIENADRFGLAQLHQLRGRVGRGEHQSYCIFISGSKSKDTKKRLEILNKSNDGFKIASEDLKLRGPGDIFGIKQSGVLDFKLADVFQDAEILKQASEAAKDIKDYKNSYYMNANIVL